MAGARAHAADMMLNNFMGHRSSSGYEFDSRMRYFLGNPQRLPQMGENAARDTQKGEANGAKRQRFGKDAVQLRLRRDLQRSAELHAMRQRCEKSDETSRWIRRRALTQTDRLFHRSPRK